jgi:hypothetical protein
MADTSDAGGLGSMPDLLTRREIEQITGIVGSAVRQRNWLKKSGIPFRVNAAGEVVIWREWMVLAGLPPELLARYIPKLTNEDEDDIGMKLGALHH